MTKFISKHHLVTTRYSSLFRCWLWGEKIKVIWFFYSAFLCWAKDVLFKQGQSFHTTPEKNLRKSKFESFKPSSNRIRNKVATSILSWCMTKKQELKALHYVNQSIFDWRQICPLVAKHCQQDCHFNTRDNFLGLWYGFFIIVGKFLCFLLSWGRWKMSITFSPITLTSFVSF